VHRSLGGYLVTTLSSNLIAVPSCLACNRGASLDDEYFKLVALFKEDAYDHPAVQQLLPSAYRSLTKPKKFKFAQAFYRSLEEIDVKTPAGLYLGKRPTYRVDLFRLDRVAERVAKGLFYHEWKTRLPDSHKVIAYSETGLENIGSETKNKLQRILGPLFSGPEKVIGPDVFSYRFERDESYIYCSVWLLTFFRSVRFICLTVPRELPIARK
jgi:hypothetical protein